MKILVSGATGIQVGREPIMNYVSFHPLFVKILRELGHEVDNRPVVIGEDLSKYDRLVIASAPIASMGARWTYSALWAMSWWDRVPVGSLIDDWDARPIGSSIRIAASGAWNRLFRTLETEMVPRFDKEWVEEEENQAVLKKTVRRLRRDYPQTIAPFFKWGDNPAAIFGSAPLPFREIAAVDPSPIQTNFTIEPVADSEKKRQWIMATLRDWSWWYDPLKLEWPIINFGHLKSKQPRIDESQVVKQYAESWGVLVPKYPHAGHGWWRTRVVFAALAGAISMADRRDFIADKEDSRILCPDPKKLFDMSDAELAEYRDKQAAWVLGNIGTKQELYDAVEAFVQGLTVFGEGVPRPLEGDDPDKEEEEFAPKPKRVKKPKPEPTITVDESDVMDVVLADPKTKKVLDSIPVTTLKRGQAVREYIVLPPDGVVSPETPIVVERMIESDEEIIVVSTSTEVVEVAPTGETSTEQEQTKTESGDFEWSW